MDLIRIPVFAVPPKKPRIRDDTGRQLTSKMGPYRVGDEAVLTCTTKGGKCEFKALTQGPINKSPDLIPAPRRLFSRRA